MVTGHSQGGGLAQICAFDLAWSGAKPFFLRKGSEKNKNNRIKLFTLSAPRVAGSVLTAEIMEEFIGTHNIIRYRSPFDVVTHVGLSNRAKKMFDIFRSLINVLSPLNYNLFGYLGSGFIHDFSGLDNYLGINVLGYEDVGIAASESHIALLNRYISNESKFDENWSKVWSKQRVDKIKKLHMQIIEHEVSGKGLNFYAITQLMWEMKSDFITAHHFGLKQEISEDSQPKAMFSHSAPGTNIKLALLRGRSLKDYLRMVKEEPDAFPINALDEK